MIGKTTRPAALFAFAFFKEAAVIADPILDPLDRLLEDPSLLTLSTQVLATRSLEVGRAARTFTQARQEQLKQSYKKLIMFLSPFSLSPLPSANYLPYRTLILPFARTCLSISATTFDGASEAEEASFATSSAYTVMT